MGLLETIISQDQPLRGHGRWLKGEINDSLVVDTEKQIFFWNSRELVGDAVKYLTSIRGMSFSEAIYYLKQFDGYSDTFVYTANSDGDDVVVYPKLIEVFWETGKSNRSYWKERCLKDSTIDRFQLGYIEGWYTIPLFIDGTFRNFQCRRDVPYKKIKHWYNGIGPLLFNSDILRLVDQVFITEGPVDAILLNQEGLPAVSTNSGSNYFKNTWINNFKRQNLIYLVMDNDKAGKEWTKLVSKVLGEHRCKVVRFKTDIPKFDTVDFFRDGGDISRFMELVERSSYSYEIS